MPSCGNPDAKLRHFETNSLPNRARSPDDHGHDQQPAAGMPALLDSGSLKTLAEVIIRESGQSSGFWIWFPARQYRHPCPWHSTCNNPGTRRHQAPFGLSSAMRVRALHSAFEHVFELKYVAGGDSVSQIVIMGAQWKQAGREANAQKRGQMVVKLVREIMVAAKLGGADPDLNGRLAAAVEKARKSSVFFNHG